MTTAIICLTALSALLFFACVYLVRRHIRYESECRRINELYISAQQEVTRLSGVSDENTRLSERLTLTQRELEKVAGVTEENARLKERIKFADIEQQRLNQTIRELSERKSEEIKEHEQQFELIARRILDAQSSALRENHNREIGILLSPLKEDITKFKARIEECYAQEARERFSLSEKIKELIDANQTIGRQAEELSTALRGNAKIQGDWGEMVLESILEKSGLRKGEEFEVQLTTDEAGNTLRDEAGHALRPDVVVRYPDRGFMVIDSKVSLTAFTDYVNSDNDSEREANAKRHVASVLKHIQELSDKNYQEYVGTDGRLDFVMMFVPNEGAYAAAMQQDPTLWQKAYDKRVVLASPTQLVGALRLVAQLWRHDRQTQNAIEIATKSGQMYDKFASFVDDMLKVERALESTGSALSEAMKKLRDGRGNLISRAEKLRALGIKASKQLPASTADDTE